MKTQTTQPQTDFRFNEISSLIVKVTHRCNLDCKYCYENISKGDDMPIAIFKQLVDRTMQNSLKKKIVFIFHGGEPTLLPDSWYSEAIKYANYKAALCGKKVSHTLQTNLVNTTAQQLEHYKSLNITLGISLDGPADIPSPFRERTEKAINNFYIAKTLGLRIGVLLTINQTNFNYFTKIMKWLENDLHSKLVKANVVYSVGHGYNLPNITPEQVHKAYTDILEYMIETNGEKVIEENIARELLRFFGNEEERVILSKTLCRAQKCGAGKNVIGVTTDGNVLPCGRFEWNNEAFTLGELDKNISEDELTKYQSLVEGFHSLNVENWFNCNSCEAKEICSYGCQAFIVRSKSKINVECIPTKMRHKYFESNISRIKLLSEKIKIKTRFLTVDMGMICLNPLISWTDLRKQISHTNLGKNEQRKTQIHTRRTTFDSSGRRA